MGTRHVAWEHDETYVGATGLACGKNHALWPWSDQEEGKDRVTDEILALFF